MILVIKFRVKIKDFYRTYKVLLLKAYHMMYMKKSNKTSKN